MSPCPTAVTLATREHLWQRRCPTGIARWHTKGAASRAAVSPPLTTWLHPLDRYPHFPINRYFLGNTDSNPCPSMTSASQNFVSCRTTDAARKHIESCTQILLPCHTAPLDYSQARLRCIETSVIQLSSVSFDLAFSRDARDLGDHVMPITSLGFSS